jgi:hypothetical protein
LRGAGGHEVLAQHVRWQRSPAADEEHLTGHRRQPREVERHSCPKVDGWRCDGRSRGVDQEHAHQTKRSRRSVPGDAVEAGHIDVGHHAIRVEALRHYIISVVGAGKRGGNGEGGHASGNVDAQRQRARSVAAVDALHSRHGSHAGEVDVVHGQPLVDDRRQRGARRRCHDGRWACGG